MPAETRAANYRWRYDNRGRGRRCYDNWSRRCYDNWSRRCYDNWSRRRDYDWPIRPTPSIRSAMKAGTTSALGTGAVDADE
jgi:hypothetical protein